MKHALTAAFAAPPSSFDSFDSSVEATRLHRLMQWLVVKAGGLTNDGSWISRYLTAIAALAVATVVRLLLDPILRDRAPYGCYLLAVLFVVWRAGLGPALLTVASGTLLARYFFESPRWSFVFDTEANQSSLFMSLTIGLVSIFLCESLRITARENARLFQLARKADARKDEFLATLAHELRNPLLPIRNAVYSLESIGAEQPRVAELHRVIGSQTEHLVRLVNDLLDVSRITQGKIALRVQPVELAAVVRGAIDAVQSLVDDKRQTLSVALPEGRVLLSADGVRLTQVLTNLLHNASKYTGPAGRIWLSAEVNGQQLTFRVRDTGIGLAADMCERIFGLFEQGQQANEHAPGGLGIGLTLVRSLVELHGGTVVADSPGPNLGSEFVVRLPVVDSVAPVEPTTPVATATPATSAASASRNQAAAPLRVLVVDDSPAVAVSLQVTIEQWQHVVQTCPDGFAALEAVRSFQPDVVLADLGLPRMSGYQLAQELRRMPQMQGALLIAVSGYGQDGDRQKSQEAGFVRHLVKPIDPDELAQILAAHADHRDSAT